MYTRIVGSCRIKSKISVCSLSKITKFTSTFISTLAELGKTNTCFLSSSSTWVIDFEATDHMINNSSLFTTIQSHPSTSPVTLANGLTSYVLRSRTKHPTPLITLTYILSLPQFSFNLISVSKLTRTLNCNISFFPYHYLILDLSTKRIIGRGSESGILYIIETEVPNSVAYSRVVTRSNYIVFWVILLSLSLSKKLYPQFSSLSSLNRESCQYAKLHCMHLSLRVNKRASVPIELVHSNVWGPCLVMSPIGFKYFITFVDDFSRVTWLYRIKSHSELFSHFSAFCAKIQT